MMEDKRLIITDEDLMEKLHNLFPSGVKYAADVMDLALKLSDVSESLYKGSFFGDYGIYPFLKVDEAHLENAGLCSKHIIFESEFDRASFDGFVASLSIPTPEFEDIMKDVDNSYCRRAITLDTCYLSVMRYLIAYLNCIVQRRGRKKSCMDLVFNVSTGYSCMVTFDNGITFPYVLRELKRHNKRHAASSGKWFRIINQTSKGVIISCEKYQPNGKLKTT